MMKRLGTITIGALLACSACNNASSSGATPATSASAARSASASASVRASASAQPNPSSSAPLFGGVGASDGGGLGLTGVGQGGGCPCGCDRSVSMVAELRDEGGPEAIRSIDDSLRTIAEREDAGYITERMVQHRLRLLGLAKDLGRAEAWRSTLV